MLTRIILSLFLGAFSVFLCTPDISLAGNSGKPPLVEKVRMGKQEGFFRVVIDLERKMPYSVTLQGKNRLVIDFPNALLSSKIGFRNLKSVKGDALESIGYVIGEGSNRQLLLELGAYSKYRTYDLAAPDRIVVDIYEADKNAPKPQEIIPKEIVKKIKPEEKSTPTSVVKVPQESATGIDSLIGDMQPKAPIETHVRVIPKGLANRAELTIVIDPGHGGKDSGAIGLYGLKEKDIVLDIGLRLRKILENKYKCNIVMTRDTDVFIPLEERTKIAEEHNASLFISIHVNATRRPNANGIETYFLSPARSEDALETQARENMVAGGKENENMSDLELIFASMKNTQKVNESSLLAGSIQNTLISDVTRKYGKVRNLGVKTAMFVVLFWASMPAVLVETSFITNPTEARRLKMGGFRQIVATSIFQGIDKYLKQASLEYNVKK